MDTTTQTGTHPGGIPQMRTVMDVTQSTEPATGPLFMTGGVEDLYEVFLRNLDAATRAEYTCRCCTAFVNKYGRLVSINEKGETEPFFWGDGRQLEEPFRTAVAAVYYAVKKAPVQHVFLSREPVWGVVANTPKAGPWAGHTWTHMAFPVPPEMWTPPHPLLTMDQIMAEKVQDFAILERSLREFSASTAAQARKLLEDGQLYRSEKSLGTATWFDALHVQLEGKKGVARKNIITAAVATAPPGFAHIRNTVIGTLLDDIQSGVPFNEIKRKFDSKMAPTQYQRPTAAPTVGAIAQAEKIVAKLGSEGSLARRFARLEEVVAIWKPVSAKAPESRGGVFGHLKPKGTEVTPAPVEGKPTTMTWEKFAQKILPTATAIEFLTKAGSYTALVTAENPDAPPILQWDTPELRNPVSWYLYQGGSSPVSWNLPSGAWVKVNAISRGPHHWHSQDSYGHQGSQILFLLEGCKDTRASKNSGGGLFPEILKTEYREIRSVLEAHTRGKPIAGLETATANGYMITQGNAGVTVRVTDDRGLTASYLIDRMD